MVAAAAMFTVWITVDLASAAEVTITEGDGKAIVKIDGEPFTEYVFTGHAKPILYPIIGPTGTEMTRNYPMKEGVDNEAHDHPHQKSIWYTHDDVNGVQFWLEYPSKGSDLKPGRIVQEEMRIDGNSITTQDDWTAPDGKVVCGDTRVLTFGTTAAGRYIDFGITIHASHGDVVFGDTKEGTMGSAKLRYRAKQLKADLDRHPELIEVLGSGIENALLPAEARQFMPVLNVYALIQWTLRGKFEGHGYGFPFDRPHLAFAKRIHRLHTEAEKLQTIQLRGEREDNKPYFKVYLDLEKIIKDRTLWETVSVIEEKITGGRIGFELSWCQFHAVTGANRPHALAMPRNTAPGWA